MALASLKSEPKGEVEARAEIETPLRMYKTRAVKDRHYEGKEDGSS